MHICLCTCEQCPQRPEESASPLELELQKIVSHLIWVLRPELGPLKEQQMLLTTEPPFQLLDPHLLYPYAFASQDAALGTKPLTHKPLA